MPRTLITGVAGFTGRYISTLLADRGHEVHGIVHIADEPIPDACQTYEADLADLPRIRQLVELVCPDHVVHLAGIAFVGHADVEQIYRSNVIGTRQLLEALSVLPRQPCSILLASSANVYGNICEGVVDETVPFAPANDYGVSKVAMEYVVSLYRKRLPLIVARPFNYTGRGQSSKFLIPKIVAHARERLPVIDLGNLDVARDFSDVRTVVQIYARLLDQPEAIGETFNVCSGRAVALREVIEMVTRLSGHPFDVRINPAFVRENEVRSLHGSNEKLEKLLGPTSSIPIEETLRWMLDD